MTTVGIQIKANEAILVVLQRDDNGVISQTNQSTKYKIEDHLDNAQIRQFKDQINVALDAVKPDRIGIIARVASAKGPMKVSPLSFKLEGIMQLYDKKKVEFVWAQTLSAFFKKSPTTLNPVHQYQKDAFELALYLLN